MSSRGRTFFLLVILVFVVHFIVTGYAVTRLTTSLDRNTPIENRFAPSFAVALCTLPLYPPIAGKLGFFGITAINSAAVATLAAFILVYLRWRAILAIIIGVPLLILIGMTATAKMLERRIQQGWSELAPHAIAPAPPGDLTSSLGNQTIEPLNLYLAKQLARGDDQIDPLPQDVEYFLIVHRSDIDALRQHLPATRDPLALFRMQKVLLVDALQTRSWQDVDAARRITAWMLQQPNFNDVLYAIAATENQLGVLRKLDAPDGGSLPSFDPHEKLIDAIGAQDARISKIAGPWYASPYTRLCLAESADSALRQAMIIRNLRGCRFDASHEIESKPRIPFNPMGVLSGGARYAIRANRLLLDREGTSHILAAKRGAPASSPAKCPDRQWLLEGNVLRLDPPLPATAPALPTRHEISAVH